MPDETPLPKPSRGRTVVGAILLLGMIAVLVWPSINGGLEFIHLSSAVVLGTFGGLLTDPRTFRDIAADLISNLPGGKK